MGKREQARLYAIAGDFTDDKRITTAYFINYLWNFGIKPWAQIREGGNYLEVAPGRGWLIEAMGWTPAATYRGLEISTQMAELSVSPGRVDIGSATDMPYDAKTFHGVFGSLVDPF